MRLPSGDQPGSKPIPVALLFARLAAFVLHFLPLLFLHRLRSFLSSFLIPPFRACEAEISLTPVPSGCTATSFSVADPKRISVPSGDHFGTSSGSGTPNGVICRSPVPSAFATNRAPFGSPCLSLCRVNTIRAPSESSHRRSRPRRRGCRSTSRGRLHPWLSRCKSR